MQPGCLVEYTGEDRRKQLGQLVVLEEDGRAQVALLDGSSTYVDPAQLRVASDLRRPGEAGAAQDSFDVFVGPATSEAFLASELSACLFEKGFCVLRAFQSKDDAQAALEAVRELGDRGKLGRLPQEVEEGYLGAGRRGKVMWLDAANQEAPHPFLEANDQTLTLLAALMQPSSMDVFGQALDERCPALISLPLADEEEDEYPSPMADDKTLGDYLSTWRRGLVRAVAFLGPSPASVTLENKEGPSSASLPRPLESVLVSAPINTIVIFRTDIYEYACQMDDEILTMMTSYLSLAPSFVLDSYYGDPSQLITYAKGPQDTSGDRINVMAFKTRLAASFDEPEANLAGLKSGCDCAMEIPFTRFDLGLYWCPDPDDLFNRPGGATVQRHTSYIDGIELFDNKYFEIVSSEAAGMGPMQRQVLECGGGILFKQGISKKDTNRKSYHASFSVGLDKDDFPDMLNSGQAQVPGGGQNAMAIIANRFSFVFNLKGPNYVCDTACSSSLTATHLAKLLLQERRFDKLDFHIAMGCHLCLSPLPWIGCSMGRMVSPEGRCFTFNASANGYLRGDGTSGVFLKHSSEDEEALAVYRASQSGQDGRSASLTAPNGPAQEYIIKNAIEEAAISAAESTTWDCHGTGTSLGDPIEVGAVRKIMLKVQRAEPLMMTSIKSYIGHLEGGAAMTAITKALLQVARCEAFSSLHLNQLNPNLEQSQFDNFFESECNAFTHSQGMSHVSSFGFGGTNGHIIFWGKKLGDVPDLAERVLRRLKSMSLPEVRPIGDDPGEWESDLPDADAKPGDRYSISITGDDPSGVAPMRYVKERSAEELEVDDVSFCITGNFNSWELERMEPGNLPGQNVVTVEVPLSGTLEFRFIQDDDPEKVLCPATPSCSQKTGEILGPAPGLTNSWVVQAYPRAEVQVELFKVKDRIGVVWFVR